MKFWDWEKNKELKGIFTGQLTSVGHFKKNVFVFRIGKETIYVWSSVQLNNLLTKVPFKTSMLIKYLGWELMPESGRRFRNFDIEFLTDD